MTILRRLLRRLLGRLGWHARHRPSAVAERGSGAGVATAEAVVAGVTRRRALPPRTPAAPGAVINLDEVRRRLRRSA
ncbi:hypothetical protein JOD67_003477 [Tenggerimyces flavus]|nr:hypothetical protein [Tenggerimyces flavus]